MRVYALVTAEALHHCCKAMKLVDDCLSIYAATGCIPRSSAALRCGFAHSTAGWRWMMSVRCAGGVNRT